VTPAPSVDSVLYIIDRKGNLVNKVNTGLPYANDPVFSPDGRQIAFRGATRKSKREQDFIDEIYIIREDGTNLNQLTHYPIEDTTAAWYAYRAGPPRWHPTENFVSYQSFQEGKYSLFGVSPDGDRQWKLTNLKEQEGYHDWSPDGRWLTMEVFDSAETQFHIAVMDWSTKEMQIVTDTTYRLQQSPVFVKKIGSMSIQAGDPESFIHED
jgi:TolB protein